VAVSVFQNLTVNPEDGRCLQLNTTQLDALFRKAKQKALIEDLHFHDTRHTAITRLAKKLDVLPLARIVGHKDLRQLMVYYNESAETLAQQLA
jgi:integrase